jgi:UDP-4-amino-4,6-dideoxy-N-acetyl-beta-L-altrosamine transaminase
MNESTRLAVETDALALLGGRPIRDRMLPYGRQQVDESDIRAVVETLRGDWLTNGPTVVRFEEAFAAQVGARFAVAVSSGTAALHAAAHVAGLGPGDEVILSPLTFLATANCLLYCGATPIFADIDPATLNLDPGQVERKLSPRTKAILPVHFAGLPCDLDRLQGLARAGGLRLIEDAAHALGAEWDGRRIGSIGNLTSFSFHPVKHVATGEGGMVTTDEPALAEKLRRFRNHGIERQVRDRQGTWRQDMVTLGFNYRLSDIHSALGLSQLGRLEPGLRRREAIAIQYEAAFAGMPEILAAPRKPGTRHAWHIYPLRLHLDRLREDREAVFRALRAENIGASVHYLPVHLHPFYRERFGTGRGLCPAAEDAADRLLTLPLFPQMTDGDAADVIAAVGKVIRWARR